MQRVKPGIGEHFHGVEKALATQFLPADIDPSHLLACLTVKYACIAIADPAATSDIFYEASTLVCSHLTAAVRGVEAEVQTLQSYGNR
jgi:hypothetical protein